MKKREIEIAGDCWGEYEISFWSYIGIQLIRLYLCMLRWFRRIKRGIGYCKYALAVIPLWGIYVVVVYFWGSFKPEGCPIGQILWDMKTGFFTSVVLAGATSFITQRSKNKHAFLEQHRVYVSIMRKCSRLYKDLSKLLCDDSSKEHVPFWPFYTVEMCRATHKQFAYWRDYDMDCAEYKHVVRSIAELKRALEELGQSIYIGSLSECNSYELSGIIDDCNSNVVRLERCLEVGESPTHKDSFVWGITISLYKLIDCLRFPWRRDLKWKLKVLRMIYKQDATIAGTFYDRAFLDVVDYDWYEQAVERKEYAEQTETEDEGCCV